MLKVCGRLCAPRRVWWIAALGMVIASLAGQAVADDPPRAETVLPIRRVVLFTSGVGFFEREGKIVDDVTIELRFGTRDINDLLKSLVLEDLSGGTVTAVSYSPRNPVGTTLKTFSIDLTSAPTLAEILQQARGERVRIAGQQAIEGKILGVEHHQQTTEQGSIVEWDTLNLLTDLGLISVRLDDRAKEIRFLDERLNAELNEALGLLVQARSTDKKTVALRCTGKGERTLRVGYIQETPVWKTSYRLLLREGEKPFLQGWAIAENTSDHDWNDVRLHLVSGRPISFMMDLYQPLYAVRQVVKPELFASLRPQRYGQDLLTPLAKPAAGKMGGMGGGAFGGMGGMGGGFGGGAMAPTDDGKRLTEASKTVSSVAQAAEVGELFRYSIKNPVTLERQKSAMLPIVNEPIEGEKVSIFNAKVDPRHPLNGFRLKNNTALHWSQGPIGVYDAGEFAGDAQIADVPPQASRLISYALDLDVEVVVAPIEEQQRIAELRLENGEVKIADRGERKTRYRLKNSGSRPRTILLEHPLDAVWKLVQPERPTEQTRDDYRFQTTIPADRNAEFVVVEARDISQTRPLQELSDAELVGYLKQPAATDAFKEELSRFAELREARQQAAKEVSKQQDRIREVAQEQDRVRTNMESLEKSSDLYKRYVKKLNDLEDALEKLRTDMTALLDDESQAQRAVKEFEPNPFYGNEMHGGSFP